MNPSPAIFAALSEAACDAQIAGKEQLAVTMDQLARTENARLLNRKNNYRGGIGEKKTLTWRDVPSVLPREPNL